MSPRTSKQRLHECCFDLLREEPSNVAQLFALGEDSEDG